jgi:hypothetical protein
MDLMRRTPRPEAYTAQCIGMPTCRQLVVLGSYETVCGGMDTLNKQEAKMALLRKYAIKGNAVIFEGVLTGGTYGEMGAFSEQPDQRGRWLYLFMDTPFEVCVQRVLARRAARGNTSPFDPEKNMRDFEKRFVPLIARAQQAGHPVAWINHKLSPSALALRLIGTMQWLGAQQ